MLRWRRLGAEAGRSGAPRHLIRGLDAFTGGYPAGCTCIAPRSLGLAAVNAGWLQGGQQRLHARADRPVAMATHPRPGPEGIALLDVAEEGWQLRYANAALGRLVGRPVTALPPRFWQLFGPSPGGMQRDDVEKAVASRQPLTTPCSLLPVSASSGDDGGQMAALAAGLPRRPRFLITLTPADSPAPMDPHEPAISIPQYFDSSSCRSAASGMGSSIAGGASRAGPQYWFAAVQPVEQQEAAASSAASTGGVCSSGSFTSLPAAPASRLERLRPASMRHVQLGPLLGCGASGRWGWMGLVG